jgi:hypothetical protein
MGGACRRGLRNANEIFVGKPYVKRLLGRHCIYLFINELTRKRTDISNQLISWSWVHLNKFYANRRFAMFRRGHNWILSWINRIQCTLSHFIFSLLFFDKTRTAYKTMPPTILCCRRNVFTDLFPSNDGRIHSQTRRFSFDKTRTAYKTMPPTILCCRGNVFTEPLPSTEWRDTHTDGGIYEGSTPWYTYQAS